MKNILFLFVIIFMASCSTRDCQKLTYPITKKTDQTDTYFGTAVSDPYRWLENDTSAETAAWVKEQNKLTFGYLEKIPFREKIKERITKLWNYPKESSPFWEGGYYFFYKNDGLQNQSVLYMRETIDGEARIILDPNKLSQGGTSSIAGLGITKDGKYLAYSVSEGGSDWNEIYVKDIRTGQDLKDQIKWVKFSGIACYKDGFFYSRYDAPRPGSELTVKNEYHKIYYHKIGTSQDQDQLIYQNREFPLRSYSADVSEDEKYLFVYESEGTQGNRLYYKDLSNEKSSFIAVNSSLEFDFGVVNNVDNKLFIRTNYKAPRYRLICVDIKNINETNWKDIIPEDKKDVLESCTMAGGKLAAVYMKDAHSKVTIYDLNGTLIREIGLPTLCTVDGFYGKKDENLCFYTVTSFTIPATVYKYDIGTNKEEVYFKPDIDFDGTIYETKQVFYKSKDGTSVPMFIVHKKDLVMDGTNPTMLYGYGGFNVSYTPSFSVGRIIWLENGGVYVLANIRGGGEYGEEWHEAGTKLKKQNVFDDFIAAAEYLIAEKYTSPKKLAIQGGSNGGLLVGAVINQRPDLFGVALPAVGVMDMLRYHKFTIGYSWTGDYGSSDDSVQFKYLINYSPIHNIKENTDYPSVMVTTADHDDRVVPAHSFKYIATLQEKYKGCNPVLIRIASMAGHGAGKPTSKIIEEATDIYSFTFKNLDVVPAY